jgi:DNA-binding NarL/FixJ family response regulator
MESTIKVLLVDDDSALRILTSQLLNDEEDIDVVGEAGDEEEAIAQAEKFLPEIVLMDVSLGSPNNMKGAEATKKILSHFPEMKVVGFSIHEKPLYIQAMVDAGACGFIGKNWDKIEELVSIIRKIHKTKHYFSKNASLALNKNSKEPSPDECLTGIEIEILRQIAGGKPLKEIASLRNVTISTVDTQRRTMLQKLSLHTDVDLAMYALRHGIIDL